MATRAVHWHEGMFLRPHHLQAAQRFEAEQRHRAAKWDLHYNWGLRSIKIDKGALANHRLVIDSLEARLRDGTLVCSPEDAALPQLDLKEHLKSGSDRALKVFLAVPQLRVGRANVAQDGQPDAGRYFVDPLELEDENTGLNPQPLQLRRLNLKLILSNQDDHPGYEVLPIARIERPASADPKPQVDPTYIPPLLSCDAWAELQVDILRYFFDKVGNYQETLTTIVENRGIGLGSHAPDDTRIISLLRICNEARVLLEILAFAYGIHPLEAYTELCRLVGQLSIFGKHFRSPPLPRYDHDNLGYCFGQVKLRLDELFDEAMPKLAWESRPFKWVAGQMQVHLEPKWLQPAWQMFVGVQSSLPADVCTRMLKPGGQLDMKIGSAKRVEAIYIGGLRGLHFVDRPRPRELPGDRGLAYFQVNRDVATDEWEAVKGEGFLAIRINEKSIRKATPGDNALTIEYGGQNVQLHFTLYVLQSTGP
jgi:type VI secretion system protein ImpJ